NGKPIAETRALVASAAGTFQFFAGACETLEEMITPARGDYLTMSIHEPMGVIAAITPFSGIKESGLGTEKGRLGILQYKHQKSLYWGMNEMPLPWAD